MSRIMIAGTGSGSGKTTVENKRRMKFNLFGKRERKPSADYAGA